jgi:hypothetical protein
MQILQHLREHATPRLSRWGVSFPRADHLRGSWLHMWASVLSIMIFTAVPALEAITSSSKCILVNSR